MNPNTPTKEDLLLSHGKDVLSRTVKTFVAVYAAFVMAGGLNLLHVQTAKEVTLGGLAAIVTAVWNAGLKAYSYKKGTLV